MPRPFVVAALCAGLLSGCLSPPERPDILVSTTPPGASCTLTRLGQPIATAGPTPAIALVDPGPDPITVTCRREGFVAGTVTLPAQHVWPGLSTIVYRQPSYTYQGGIDIALVPAPH